MSTANDVPAAVRGARRPRHLCVPRVPRVLGVALAALLLMGFASACNPDRLGAAALVDGKQISTTTLQEDARSYLSAVPDADQKDLQRKILERLILSRVIAKAARDNGIAVRRSSVASYKEQIYAQTKNAKGLVRALAQQQSPEVIPPRYVDQWIKDQLLYRRLITKLAAGGDPTSQAAATKASSSLMAAGKAMHITVNPRYGTWDPSRGITAALSGGLARPATELSRQ